MTIDEGKIPAAIDQHLELMDGELLTTIAKWQYYKELFDSGEARLDLLEEVAVSFFVDLRRILMNEVILGISRLTDGAGIGARSNLSLQRLVDVARESGFNDLAGQLQPQLDLIKQAADPVRAHRDRRIAHKDAKQTLKQREALPGVTTKMIDNILSLMGALMNNCRGHFIGGRTVYDHVVTAMDAGTLVDYLKEAVVFRQLYLEDPTRWHPVREAGKYARA